MNIKYMFILILFILILPAVSASDVSEAIVEDESIIENLYIDELSDNYIDDLKIETISFSDNFNDYYYCEDISYEDISYEPISYEDITYENINVDSSIGYYENLFKGNFEYFCENFSHAEISTENISCHIIDSIEQPVTLNLNTLHDLDLEIHIFMSSYEEFRFYESVDFDNLIFDLNFVVFDYVISKDLNKDVIICAKKIKVDYVYSIDNLISNSFSLNILSDFNSFLNSHFKYSKSSVFILMKLNGVIK